MSSFLTYFQYETVIINLDGSQVFRNVTFLRPIGKYKPGDKVETLSLLLTFYIWTGDDFIEDITIPV